MHVSVSKETVIPEDTNARDTTRWKHGLSVSPVRILVGGATPGQPPTPPLARTLGRSAYSPTCVIIAQFRPREYVKYLVSCNVRGSDDIPVVSPWPWMTLCNHQFATNQDQMDSASDHNARPYPITVVRL